MAHAYQDQRIVVTLDKDFGELAVRHRQPHAGIVRLVNFSIRLQAAACLQILEHYSGELERNAVVTAEPGYVRIRLPDPPAE